MLCSDLDTALQCFAPACSGMRWRAGLQCSATFSRLSLALRLIGATRRAKSTGHPGTWWPEDEKELYLRTAAASASFSVAPLEGLLLVTEAARVLTHVTLGDALKRWMLRSAAKPPDAHDVQDMQTAFWCCRCTCKQITRLYRATQCGFLQVNVG